MSRRARLVLDLRGDMDGTPIPVRARVEQIGIDAELGALRSWLGKLSQVLRRSATRQALIERFTFIPAGEQGSLWGERVTKEWQDIVFLGASGYCNAARAHKSLLVPGESLFAERVSGNALTVLRTVVYGWTAT